MSQIAVLGLSAFGRALVWVLVQERCRVLAVDIDDNKVNAVRELVDEAVIANARDPRVLEALRLHDYDVVVLSLGEPLDTSLLAALYLRDLKVKRIMAKAVSSDARARTGTDLALQSGRWSAAWGGRHQAQTCAIRGGYEPQTPPVEELEARPVANADQGGVGQLVVEQRHD
jgi:hypothetical protein